MTSPAVLLSNLSRHAAGVALVIAMVLYAASLLGERR